jgi:YaiO family outer membrane protein
VADPASKALCVSAALWALAGGAHADADANVDRAIERSDYATASQYLRAELDRSPGDEAARFKLAQVLAWSRDYGGAIAEYDTLIDARPRNVDYIFGKAQALSWDRRDAEALTELERARSLAPDYEDVWRLELAILERGDDAGRRDQLRDAAARRFPQARWWQATERPASGPAAPALKLTAGTVHEALSTSAPDWQRLFVEVDRRRDAGGLHAGVGRDERFGLRDVTLDGGADWRISARWSTGVDLALGPDADFMPRTAASMWALRSLRDGWETEFRVGHRTYGEASVTSTGLGFSRYFGDFRAAYRVDFAELDGATTSAAQSVTLNYYRSPRTDFRLTFVTGQEAEAVGPGAVLRTDVSGFSAGARHPLGERFGLSWWLGSQRQGTLYRRKYVGVSLTAGL